MAVDVLILGAGWTASFLIPLCKEKFISYAATTRDGRDGTLKFTFNPESGDPELYRALPDARTVLITFPITTPGGSRNLVHSYTQSRHEESKDRIVRDIQFIQLGTTGIWDGQRKAKDAPAGLPKPVENKWYDRHTPFVPNDRAKEEIELLKLSSQYGTTVLNLVGLWGGMRSARNWVVRVAPSKEALKNKGSIHLIHGTDLARAILAVHAAFSQANGQRWIISDGRVYDWWNLASAWGVPTQAGSSNNLTPDAINEEDGERGPYARWVRELMEEEGVRALPRNVEVLGRAIDSRDFWQTFKLMPQHTLLQS